MTAYLTALHFISFSVFAFFATIWKTSNSVNVICKVFCGALAIANGFAVALLQGWIKL